MIMHRKFVKARTVFVCLLVLLAFSLSPAQKQALQAQGTGTVTYHLYATDGYISLADGTQSYIYGFVGGRSTEPVLYQNSVTLPKTAPKGTVPGGLGPGGLGPCVGQNWPAPTGGPIAPNSCEQQLAGHAQFPAPLIWANVGQVVEIRLKNLGVTNRAAPNDPHSIHLHGLDVNAANDGVPETSLGAVPANAAIPGAGNVVVYMFTADKPGTYMYHCHQEADIHVQMGMYGALVVYEGSASPGGSGTLWGWNYDKDYILLLSEFDQLQHQAEQFAGVARGYNPVDYKPQYWFINGLGFPSTIHVAPPGAAIPPAGTTWFDGIWLPTHKGYDPFIRGSVSTGQKVLLRMINMGFQTHPMHMHGFHGKIIGSDQREWAFAQPAGDNVFNNTGMEKNTLTIGSGETYEWLLDFGTWTGKAAGDYAAGTQSRYVVGTNAPAAPNTANPAIPDPFAPVVGWTYVGGPTVGPIYDLPGTVGDSGSVPGHLLTAAGIQAFNGQLFPFHNHDDYKATNNGVYPGGMFTMIATEP